MKKFFRAILFILSIIWQLPQTLVGAFMWLYFKILGDVEFITEKNLNMAFKSGWMRGGISLGNFSFVSTRLSKSEESIAHEQLGHSTQSHILGPLYLFVIGLPSLIWAVVYWRFKKCYYSFFTESWSNSAAGLGVDDRCELYFKEQQ